MTECRASKVTTVPVRSSGVSSARKCVVSFVFAPTSTWARVTTVPCVTAESRCRRVAVRRADPLSALPSTAITRGFPDAELDGVLRGLAVPVGQVGAHRPVQGVTVDSPQHTADRGRRRSVPPSEQVAADPDDCQECVRGPLAPLGEFVDGPRSSDDRAGTHQQDRRQRVPPAAACARVGHRVEVGAQVGDPARVQRTQLHQHGRDGEDAAAGTGTLMIIWLSHHNDHEARACTATRPYQARSPTQRTLTELDGEP